MRRALVIRGGRRASVVLAALGLVAGFTCRFGGVTLPAAKADEPPMSASPAADTHEPLDYALRLPKEWGGGPHCGEITEPHLVSGPDPEYPEAAIDTGIEGLAVIQCVIVADGGVRDCKVLESPPLLGASALAALERRRYRPATFNAEPVDVDYKFQLNFSLPEPVLPDPSHFPPVLEPSGGPPKCPEGWQIKAGDCWRTCTQDSECPNAQTCACANKRDCAASPFRADNGVGDVSEVCVSRAKRRLKWWKGPWDAGQ
jgi:TonB family protein